MDFTEDHILAGQISNAALIKGAKLIKVGADMTEVLDQIEQMIIDMGGKIAFPAQISLNDTAAHFCPTEQDNIIFKEGDIAKLDLGVHINGRIADNALTVNLGNHDELTQASKDALNAALKLVRPGAQLGDIGRAIQQAIESYNLHPVHNLSGHGLGHYQIHTKPNIPNVDTGDTTELQEGMVIAIEPFASTGSGEIFESSNPSIFTLTGNRPVRSPMTRNVLAMIKEYEGLPFTTRWLTKIHGVGKTSYALRELQAAGNLIAHPPLPDTAKGLVSQHEHSIIVQEKPIIFTRPSDNKFL